MGEHNQKLLIDSLAQCLFGNFHQVLFSSSQWVAWVHDYNYAFPTSCNKPWEKSFHKWFKLFVKESFIHLWKAIEDTYRSIIFNFISITLFINRTDCCYFIVFRKTVIILIMVNVFAKWNSIIFADNITILGGILSGLLLY